MPNYRSPGVYIEERESGSRPIEGVGTAVAAFVGATMDGPFNKPTLVTNWGQFVSTFGGFLPDGYLPVSLYSYFANGGGAAYVVRVGTDGHGSAKPTAELTSAVVAGKTIAHVEALESSSASDPITVDIVRSASGEGEEPNPEVFDVFVRRGTDAEEYRGLTAKRGTTNWVTALNQSSLVMVREMAGVASADRAPTTGTLTLTALPQLPTRVTQGDLIGDSGGGIAALERVDNVTMIAVPDLMAAHEAGAIDLAGVQAVQTALMDHCALMKDRMAILDPPRGMSPQDIREWLVHKVKYDSPYAALFYPWLKVSDPLTRTIISIPPSGAVAGIWGRNDDTRGVWKAPANEIVNTALGLDTDVTRREHDELNPVGINVIRAFPGRGIRVWGARTLSSDSDWRYINVRRLFNYIESSILVGTQWVVFEPNDLDLWQRIKRTVTGFLLGLWRDGALFGATPEQAFYVKCDEETNPPQVIDDGRVIIEIGIAPVKPAEFVVFRLAQLSSSGVTE